MKKNKYYNMKSSKIIILAIILFIITSCSSNKNIVKVENINNVKKYTENSLIYALPKTVIVVDIEVSKITKRKGPFYSYTEDFLGSIKNIIKTNSTEWAISSINFRTYPGLLLPMLIKQRGIAILCRAQ